MTRAGRQPYLRIHVVPFFGRMPLARIMPATVQAWVSRATGPDLSPRSITKYHVMPHSIVARAVRDRILAFNPCEATELPKVIAKKYRTLTPDEFDRLLAAMPDRFKAMVLTDIETGLRWGELVALRPRHIDVLRRTLTVEETIVEISRKDSPTGERMLFTPYPKDDEPWTLRVSQDLLDTLAARIAARGLSRDDLLFPSRDVPDGTLLLRATFTLHQVQVRHDPLHCGLRVAAIGQVGDQLITEIGDHRGAEAGADDQLGTLVMDVDVPLSVLDPALGPIVGEHHDVHAVPCGAAAGSTGAARAGARPARCARPRSPPGRRSARGPGRGTHTGRDVPMSRMSAPRLGPWQP